MDTTDNSSLKSLYESFKSPYLDSYFDEAAKGSIKGFMFLNKLQVELFNAEDTGVNSRILNHWKESELFLIVRKGKHNRFSFLELFWIFIIRELREYGFSIGKIKRVKSYLFNPFVEEIDKPYSPAQYQKIYDETGQIYSFNNFGFAFAQLIMLKKEVVLVITKVGESAFVHFSDIKPPTHSCIIIPLSSILTHFLRDSRNIMKALQGGIISVQEKEVIEVIRSGNFSEITIFIKDQKPIRYKATKESFVVKGQKVEELILKGGYQKIEITTSKGEIVHSTIEVSKYL